MKTTYVFLFTAIPFLLTSIFLIFHANQAAFGIACLFISLFCFYMCRYTAKSSKPGAHLIFFGCGLVCFAPVFGIPIASYLGNIISHFFPAITEIIPIPEAGPIKPTKTDVFIVGTALLFVLAGIITRKDRSESIEDLDEFKNRVKEKK